MHDLAKLLILFSLLILLSACGTTDKKKANEDKRVKTRLDLIERMVERHDRY